MDEVTHAGAVRGRGPEGGRGAGVFMSMAPSRMHSKQRFGVRPGQGPGDLNFKCCPK